MTYSIIGLLASVIMPIINRDDLEATRVIRAMDREDKRNGG